MLWQNLCYFFKNCFAFFQISFFYRIQNCFTAYRILLLFIRQIFLCLQISFFFIKRILHRGHSLFICLFSAAFHIRIQRADCKINSVFLKYQDILNKLLYLSDLFLFNSWSWQGQHSQQIFCSVDLKCNWRCIYQMFFYKIPYLPFHLFIKNQMLLIDPDQHQIAFLSQRKHLT